MNTFMHTNIHLSISFFCFVLNLFTNIYIYYIKLFTFLCKKNKPYRIFLLLNFFLTKKRNFYAYK